jgi:Subtilisin inhibitor-like
MLLASVLAAAALGGTPATSLAITLWPDGRDHAARRATLRCGPVGGTLARRAAACSRLLALAGNPFTPAPGDAACTQIYGGPQEALVRGRFRERHVWARFSRRDGCQIARWNRVSFLFGLRL